MKNIQSSIEWLEEQYYQSEGKLTRHEFEKAKAMHREETEHYGAKCCMMTLQKNQWSLEQLYNETFGVEK